MSITRIVPTREGTFPMIDSPTITRARAPMRLGQAGRGTDLSPYCDTYGGAVLNVTINLFAYASILPRQDRKIVFEASDLGVAESFDLNADLSAAKLELHRGVYDRMMRQFADGRRVPLTLQTNVEAPAGSGLGSSSALVGAMVDAFRTCLSAPLGPYDVARLAFEVERHDLSLAGGRQDQYAAAFGGINFIEFLPEERVIVNPLRIGSSVINELECKLVTCFSGRSRNSATIIDRQTKAVKTAKPKALDALHQLRLDCVEMKRALMVGDFRRMADLLNQSWAAKKATASGISTGEIDRIFDTAMAEGALAGKVSGAGGGGFMFFLVEPHRRQHLLDALNRAGGEANSVKFSERGCESWHLAAPIAA